jgi:tetratricopeptide (TPR) repeat protein
MALGISVGGVYGYRQGERDRHQTHLEEAEQHYDKGLARLNDGEYELAIAEFEYVLELAPSHPLAQQRIDEAEARIAARPTPTVEIHEIVAADLYQKALIHYQAEEWEEATAILGQLRVLDATYEAEAVEEMLFTSLYNAGIALLDEDRLEEGIFYLDQAIALRPLDEEALAQRRLAVQYMTALGYWGVDWERCIDRFGQIYAVAPNYKDVFRRLYEARVSYADAWYAQEEMCPAEEQYTEALRLMSDSTVEQKLAEAVQVCAIATPTPIAPLEGTHTITLTEMPPGFDTGKLAYPVYNTQSGLYDVYTLFIDGRLVQMASGADQPHWLWGNGILGYRNLVSPGISLLVPGEAAPRQLTSEAGIGWPTFSPDNGRMAYAVQDVAGVWQIHIAPMDGSAESQVHATGKGPTWGPTGLLAWTGCDASGACGIFLDNPDDDQPPAAKTASINDVGLNWAPNGGALVYMSNITGNWDVYLLSVDGGVVALTDDPASDGLPVWSPDGSSIAFASNRDGAWGIYLMGLNGEDQHKILTLGPSLPNWTSQRLSWAP